MCAMFQQAAQPAGEVHVEFKAGRLQWDGRMLTPEKEKGKVVLITTEEEGLMHLQWQNRTSKKTETDLIVINDCFLEKIDKCTDGRVYVARFTSSDKKLFFWMQEPKEDDDKKVIDKFNETVGAKIPDKKKPTTAPTVPATSGGAAASSLDPELRAILEQLRETQGGQQAQAAAQRTPVSLGSVLSAETTQSLLTDDAAIEELSALLPEGYRTSNDVREALASPQMQQSLSSLTQAIYSDQLPLLFSSLGLDPTALATLPMGSDPLEIMCQVLERQFGAAGGAAEDVTTTPSEANATAGEGEKPPSSDSPAEDAPKDN